MQFKAVVLSALLVLSLTACVEPSGGDLQVVEVTDYDFKLNGQSAVTVFVGYAGAPQYGFSLYKSDIKKGTFLQSSANSAKNFRADANIGAEYYVQSKDFDTSASLQIMDIDEQAKTVKLAVGAKLINLQQKDYTELKITTVELSGINYEHFMKSH